MWEKELTQALRPAGLAIDSKNEGEKRRKESVIYENTPAAIQYSS